LREKTINRNCLVLSAPEFAFLAHIKRISKTDANLFEEWNLESNIHRPNTGIAKKMAESVKKIK
jgi:hypothetical protein